MPIRRRQKASEVFGQRPFRIRDFPEVQNLTVEVDQEGEGVIGPPRRYVWGRGDPPEEYVDCCNPLCYKGGIFLGAKLHNMILGRRRHLKTLEVCQGYEGSPKGRVQYRPCLNTFRIEVSITYKKGSDREARANP